MIKSNLSLMHNIALISILISLSPTALFLVHRPVVPHGTFRMYSRLQMNPLVFVQIREKVKSSQFFHIIDGRSIILKVNTLALKKFKWRKCITQLYLAFYTLHKLFRYVCIYSPQKKNTFKVIEFKITMVHSTVHILRAGRDLS